MSKQKRIRIYVRHYCSECGSRIFPFDKYEDRTEVSSMAKNGQRILLKTANHKDADNRVAWCWSCNQFVDCQRLEEDDFLQRYIKRKGVSVRDVKLKGGHHARR